MSFSEDSFNAGGQSSRSQLLAPGIRLWDYTPSWEGLTIFQPYPCIDQATGQPLPMRAPNTADGKLAYTDWTHRKNTVIRAGMEGRASVHFDTQMTEDEQVQYLRDPYTFLYDAVQQLIKTDVNGGNIERQYMKGKKGRGGAMEWKPGTSTFYQQGTLHMHKGAAPKNGPSTNVLLCSKGSYAKELGGMLGMKDAQGNLVMPDMFNPADIAFASIKQGMSFTGDPNGVVLNKDWNILFPDQARKTVTMAEAQTMPGYGVTAVRATSPGVLNTKYRPEIVPWDRVFQRLSVPAQLGLLCTAFDHQILGRVFLNSQFEDILPKHVKAAYTSGAVQGWGAGPQAQGYTQQGYQQAPAQQYPPQGQQYPPQGYQGQVPPQSQQYPPQGYQQAQMPPQGPPAQQYPPQGGYQTVPAQVPQQQVPQQPYPPQHYPPQGGYQTAPAQQPPQQVPQQQYPPQGGYQQAPAQQYPPQGQQYPPQGAPAHAPQQQGEPAYPADDIPF